MHASHRKELLKALKANLEAVKGNKQEALKQLVSVGILNAKGEIQAPYKNLCIPQSQA